MHRRILLVVGGSLILATAFLLIPRWYASHDAWKEERMLNAEKDARGKEAWKAYSQMPWRRLREVDGRFQEAAQMVASAMETEGLNQDDYRIKAVQWPESDSYNFTIQHIDEFALEREGKTKNVLGDPCGKCRVAFYDPTKRVLSRLYFVQ